jgi:hypothetical protein
MPTVKADGAYFCEVCTTRYDAAGDCAKCDQEPLLDLRQPDVVEMIQSFDQRRWQQRLGIYTALGAAVAIPGVIVLNLLMAVATDYVLGLVPNVILAGIGVSAISGGLIAVLPPMKRLPRNLPT